MLLHRFSLILVFLLYLCAGNVNINPLKQYANELNKQETCIWEAFANFANGFPQNELNNK